jgi:hypothetical protein
MGFTRAKGYRPHYTPIETARYMSRKARMTRGMFLQPNHQAGNKYYFLSPRGPAETGGFWVVDVAPKQLDSGDGSSSGGDTSTAPSGIVCPAAGTTLEYVFACWQERISNVPWVEDQHPGYCTRTDGAEIYTDSSFVSTANWSGNESLTEAYTSSWNWLWTEWVVRISWTIGENAVAPNIFDYGGYYPETFPFAVVQVGGPGISYQNNAGYGSPWCSYTPAPEPPTEPTVPPGYLPGASYWAYHCSCPDFSQVEPAYLKPQFPHHHSSHDFTSSHAGVFNFPCKHIVAAAREHGDMLSIVAWANQARNDLPAREYWRNYNQAWQEWREDYDRQREERWRQQQLDRYNRRQAWLAEHPGIWRPDENGILRLEYGHRPETYRGLSDIWDMNTDGYEGRPEYRGRLGAPLPLNARQLNYELGQLRWNNRQNSQFGTGNSANRQPARPRRMPSPPTDRWGRAKPVAFRAAVPRHQPVPTPRALVPQQERFSDKYRRP